MAKRTGKIKRDKSEYTHICVECGNFFKDMDEMDTHLYRRHGAPVYVIVSKLIN